MLQDTQYAMQYSNPYVIKALTETHGVYVNVYNKLAGTIYDEGRDNYISNESNKFSLLSSKKKLLLYDPVQGVQWGSGRDLWGGASEWSNGL